MSVAEVVHVARQGGDVSIAPSAERAMNASRRVVERRLKDGDPHYGINTGFGSLAKVRIGAEDLRTLQRNLIRSHSAGAGDALPAELVRGTMLLLAASLARGHSGVRPEVVGLLRDLLNRGVTPVVPSLGSVGASGDLAPLAAIALVMIGEGRAVFRGRELAASAALAKAGLMPVILEAKEGLALINGTHLMAASGALLAHDAEVLFRSAVAALAMTIDACRATHAFLDDRLYQARANPGPLTTAAMLRALLHGSQIATSHLENDPRVQDPYSLRAGPTVLGAVDWALTQFTSSVQFELGAVTDNPLVFPDDAKGTGDIVSGANFHGMPIALPMDQLAIALAHIAGISERRTYLMTGAFEPESHLKPFLAPRPGLESGLMIAQYTAAACVNEITGLATPATVANVPTCAGMEDYNSFGPRAAAKARRIVELATRVVAIELLCAAQALETHRPLRSGQGVERVFKLIRSVVKPLKGDRPLTPDIEALASLISSGKVASAVDESLTLE
ncbi:MAG: histidine ammonia-lyase [Planctomycetota bacterium]|nr:histidine ammonia-lyase [Planctomycetota bacterium]